MFGIYAIKFIFALEMSKFTDHDHDNRRHDGQKLQIVNLLACKSGKLFPLISLCLY